MQAMNEEIQMINKNSAWEFTSLPANKKAIGLKWLFKIKYVENNQVHKYKAKLVTKGYS